MRLLEPREDEMNWDVAERTMFGEDGVGCGGLEFAAPTDLVPFDFRSC